MCGPQGCSEEGYLLPYGPASLSPFPIQMCLVCWSPCTASQAGLELLTMISTSDLCSTFAPPGALLCTHLSLCPPGRQPPATPQWPRLPSAFSEGSMAVTVVAPARCLQ